MQPQTAAAVGPRIDAIAALAGPTEGEPRVSVDGGTPVELRGAHFRPPVEVFVGGTAVAAEGTETEVRFTAPARAAEGAAPVFLRNGDGLEAQATLHYTAEFSLEPADDRLDRPAARHLFRRAAFGGRPAEIDDAVRDGLHATVARLLDPRPDAAVEAAAATAYESYPPRGPVHRRANQEWWLHLMLFNPNPLQERMAFFWHNHFATSQVAFNDATYMMHDQVQLFRTRGLGNVRDLAVAVSRDPAMLLWLDGSTSTKDRPNENFARELWELFLLGEGNGYTEADIREASRAFTGFDLQHRPDHLVVVEYFPELHDDGEKTVLGVSGRFGYDGGLDARDAAGGIVDLTLQQRPLEASRFLCRKLLAHFLYSLPHDSLVDDLAGTLRSSGWEMRPVMKRLLGSRAMFSARARESLLKTPLDFAAGYLRATDLPLPLGRVNQALIGMGLSLCEPPDVNGWPPGEAFVSGQAVIAGMNFLNEAVATVRTEADAARTGDPDTVAEHLGLVLTSEAREEIAAYLGEGPPDPVAKARGVLYMLGQYHGVYLR